MVKIIKKATKASKKLLAPCDMFVDGLTDAPKK